MPWGSLGGFEACRSKLWWFDPLFQAAAPVAAAVEGQWWSVPRFCFLSVLFGSSLCGFRSDEQGDCEEDAEEDDGGELGEGCAEEGLGCVHGYVVAWFVECLANRGLIYRLS